MSAELHFEIEGLNSNRKRDSYPLYLMSVDSDAKNLLIEDEESLDEGIENLDSNQANALNKLTQSSVSPDNNNMPYNPNLMQGYQAY